jgi:hypothetical protein
MKKSGSWASKNLLADTEIHATLYKLGRQSFEQAKKEWWGPGMSKEEKNKIVRHLYKNSIRNLSDMLKQYADDMDRFDSRA